MSNIIPPLLSDSPPPPPPDIDDHEDDEFGDFTGTNNLSYDVDDSLSLPSSPLHLPKESFDIDVNIPGEAYDINSNSKDKNKILTEPPPLEKPKDFHDKRKQDHHDPLRSSIDPNTIEISLNNHIDGTNICQHSENISNDVKDVKSKLQDIRENSDSIESSLSQSTDQSVLQTHRKTSSDTLKAKGQLCVQKKDDIIKSNCCDIHIASVLYKTNYINVEPQEITANTICIKDEDFEDVKNINESSSFPSLHLETLTKPTEDVSNTTDKQDNIVTEKVENQLESSENLEHCESIERIHRNHDEIQQVMNSSQEIQVKSVEDSHSEFNHEKDQKNEEKMIFKEGLLTCVQNLSQECAESTNFNSSSTNIHLDTNKTSDDQHMSRELFKLDNDFGEFSTPGKVSCLEEHQNKICTEEEQHSISNHDEFGNFATSSHSSVVCESLSNDTQNESIEPLKNKLHNLESLSSKNFPETSQSKLDTDEFGDFSSMILNPTVPVLDYIVDNDDDDDFGNFATSATRVEREIAAPVISSPIKVSNSNENDQEFENFACFPSTSQENQEDEDEFGDFTAPISDNPSSKILLLDEKQAFDKSTEILREMFPMCKTDLSDFEGKNLEMNDKIFNQIKSITETHALSYHWPKSASQNLLLKSLNIDARNIMFGPGWNPSMPRFAANLSLTPLEPIKSEILTPTPASEVIPSNSSQSASVEMPQFNLNDLEVMDPLDYSQSMLLDLEQLVKQLEISTLKSTSSSLNSTSPSNELENWDAWLEPLPSRETSDSSENVKESSKDVTVFPPLELQPTLVSETRNEATKAALEEKIIPSMQTDDFDDFVSHSTTTLQGNSHGHSIILRETHISNKELSKSDETEIVSYLEPTIVTPELTRKEQKFVEPDDDFEDFQMVVPPVPISIESSSKLTVKPLDILQPQLSLKSESTSSKSALDLDFIESDLADSTGRSQVHTAEITQTNPTNDDDFGDFTYSLPSQSNPTPINPSPLTYNSPKLASSSVVPLAPTLASEPLKPSVVHSQTASSAAQISWPDPGITEDEIKRFEALNYSRVQRNQAPSDENKSKETPIQSIESYGKGNLAATEPKLNISPVRTKEARLMDGFDGKKSVSVEESFSSKFHLYNKTLQPTKKSQTALQSKQNSLEDDEWSDFVSVQNPSPVHKLKTDKDRCSTPDLPLSVLNLGSVQPAKQPIPVITPNGLVQTKLSSNMSNFPSMLSSNRSYPQPHQNHPVYQPSIISNQYASQAYGGFSNYGNYAHANTSSKAQVPDSTDDDEWSDFVSHQPTVPKQPQPKPTASWSNQPSQFTSWNSMTPNIITNPSASFDIFSSSGAQKQTKLSNPVQNKKSGVPNATLPDLDFRAPRGRTNRK